VSAYGWVYLFQGSRFDAASGLDDRRDRQYSPTLARFLQVDPAQSDENLYRFVGDNPINATDPSGRDLWAGSLGTARDFQQWIAGNGGPLAAFFGTNGPGVTLNIAGPAPDGSYRLVLANQEDINRLLQWANAKGVDASIAPIIDSLSNTYESPVQTIWWEEVETGGITENGKNYRFGSTAGLARGGAVSCNDDWKIVGGYLGAARVLQWLIPDSGASRTEPPNREQQQQRQQQQQQQQARHRRAGPYTRQDWQRKLEEARIDRRTAEEQLEGELNGLCNEKRVEYLREFIKGAIRDIEEAEWFLGIRTTPPTAP
jgi:RHS repeat-associated protein